jgi:uncharacterized membrane protein
MQPEALPARIGGEEGRYPLPGNKGEAIMGSWLLRGLLLMGVLLAIDSVWLVTMSDWLYRRHLGEILLPGFRPIPALLFYVIYVAGVVHFVLRPALEADSTALAIRNGAFFGLVCYATYDLTNHATLKVWSAQVTVFDMVWGATLTALAASITLMLCRRFLPLRRG